MMAITVLIIVLGFFEEKTTPIAIPSITLCIIYQKTIKIPPDFVPFKVRKLKHSIK